MHDKRVNRRRRSGTLLLLAVAIAVAAAGMPARGETTDVEELPFAPGALLKLRFPDGGSAIVIGWDEPKARVNYRGDRDVVDGFVIKTRKRDGGVELRTSWQGPRHRHQSLVCEIRVPRRMDLEFESAGGDLHLEDLDGSFRGETMGGDLVLRHVRGAARLRSMGGAIQVSDSRLDGELSTGGGEVLLERVIGDVEATSGGGEVRYRDVRGGDGRPRGPDGPVTGAVSEDTVLIATAGGALAIAEAPAGAEVRTAGGDVEVLRASRFVAARTGGGDVRVEIDDGWVLAETGGGDIFVEVRHGLGDGDRGVDLQSGSGDVTLVVPPGLALDLEVEISFTRNSRRDYRITFNLDLEVTRTDEWEYGRGSPRKYIRGSTPTAGSGKPVRIRTCNGDVHIREAER